MFKQYNSLEVHFIHESGIFSVGQMHTANNWFNPHASFQRLFSEIEPQCSVSEKKKYIKEE